MAGSQQLRNRGRCHRQRGFSKREHPDAVFARDRQRIDRARRQLIGRRRGYRGVIYLQHELAT
jgi:hypothetical protein